MSGSSNACVEATPGIVLADFLVFFAIGANDDNTVFMILGSSCLLPSFRMETVTLAFAGLLGIPVDEFLL